MSDQDKWIDYAAALYRNTKKALKMALDYEPEDKEIISVFEQACSFDRGERAGQQRKEEHAAREQKQEEPASEKQLRYIDDLGGDSTTIATKKQAMVEIDRLRNK